MKVLEFWREGTSNIFMRGKIWAWRKNIRDERNVRWLCEKKLQKPPSQKNKCKKGDFKYTIKIRCNSNKREITIGKQRHYRHTRRPRNKYRKNQNLYWDSESKIRGKKLFTILRGQNGRRGGRWRSADFFF